MTQESSATVVPSLKGNLTALYSVQATRYVLPLLTLPFLARVLGPSAWGAVLVAQALYTWIVLLVEYGFNLSATREVARARDDSNFLSRLAAGVLGAKLLLALLSGLCALVAWVVVPVLHAQAAMVVWAWTAAVALAFVPTWYFQGVQRVRRASGVEVLGQLAYTVGLFAVVRGPADSWKVMLVLAIANVVVAAVLTHVMLQEVRWTRPRLRDGMTLLRQGFGMFVFRGAVSLYTTANTFILALIASPVVVAAFGGAERISKAALGMFNPATQALFPHFSQLIRSDEAAAARLARRSFTMIVLAGVAAGLVLAVFAELVVVVLLGSGYSTVVPVLRVLALLVPLIAASNVFGLQWMLPLGLDVPFNAIIISAGLLNLVAAYSLGSAYGAIGMAWAITLAELYVTVAMFVYLRVRRLDFFKSR